MASLSLEETRHYQELGYVVPQFRLDEAWVRRMQDALETLIRNNPGVRPEKLVSAHIDGQGDEGVRGSRDFFDLATNPDIGDMVAQGVPVSFATRPLWLLRGHDQTRVNDFAVGHRGP